MQEGERLRYIDEASCVVCLPKHLEAQMLQLQQQQEQHYQHLHQQKQEQQQQHGHQHDDHCEHATEVAAAAAGAQGEAAAGEGSPGSSRLGGLSVAVADFTPHKLRREHVACVEHFHRCLALFRERVEPLLQHARQLLAELERTKPEIERELGWAGLGWAGLGWAGLGWAGLGPSYEWRGIPQSLASAPAPLLVLRLASSR